MIDFLKEFFGFTKKELNGLLVLCFLILIIAVAPLVYAYFKPVEKYDFSAFEKEVAAFRASAKAAPAYSYHENDFERAGNETRVPQLFSFNPNNLSVSLWEKLGLSERQIKVIKNYESKGGKFYRKEDLKKIYSIKAEQYAVLEPYIDIPKRTYPAYNLKTSYEKKPYASKTLPIIELNSADSTQLEQLNGVGPAFASRIIKYRNRLGGFHSKAQLREVYGVDSVLYDKLQNQITVNPSAIQTILINSITFAELKRHPYLSYKQMNAILKYRNQHGAYKSLADLKAIVVLDEKVLNKIAPYIRFD
ncbi:MAG TPA: helix-hairpin-helix domain-containing protein [Pedobacter sp.]|jgi:DNA uptake protein ComE-like DNA-binding protein